LRKDGRQGSDGEEGNSVFRSCCTDASKMDLNIDIEDITDLYICDLLLCYTKTQLMNRVRPRNRIKVVDVSTGLRIGLSGVRSAIGDERFFSKTSTPALERTQLPIPWAPFPQVKAVGA
jgi:hypothetical protein